MADIENQPPSAVEADLNPSKTKTHSSSTKSSNKLTSSDRKRLQTLQPSGKNQSLLVCFCF